MSQQKNLAELLREILEPVINAVGGDVKKLNGLISNQSEELARLRELIPRDAATIAQVEEKIGELRTALFGGDLDEAYDTFKELADKLKELDGNIGAAITEKLVEMRREIDSLKAKNEVDYLEIYRRAKGEV